MVAIPARWNVDTNIPSRNSATRTNMAGAQAGLLDLNPLAFEILSYVSGRRLTTANRSSLLPGLIEHLAGPPQPPLDYGPLAGADVTGVVLGLAHFALSAPGDWVFVRIPEMANTKTSDIWASRGASAPWNLEFKASAPLSEDVEHGQVLDTCRERIFEQVRAGAAQLNNVFVVGPPSGTPAVSVSVPPFTHDPRGGRALGVSVLPDFALQGRLDVLPSGVGGCPPNGAGTHACRVQCFASALLPQRNAATTLLWIEPHNSTRRAGEDGSSGQPAVGALAAIHALGLAAWANCQPAAESALTRLCNSLALAGDVSLEDRAALLGAALQQVRSVTRARARTTAVAGFMDSVRNDTSAIQQDLRDEAGRGTGNERELRSLGDPAFLEESTAGRGDVYVDTDDGRWLGTWFGDDLRLVPPTNIDDAGILNGAHLRDAAKAAFRAIARAAPRMGAEDDAQPVPVTVQRRWLNERQQILRSSVQLGIAWWPSRLPLEFIQHCEQWWPPIPPDVADAFPFGPFGPPLPQRLAWAANDGRLTVHWRSLTGRDAA